MIRRLALLMVVCVPLFAADTVAAPDKSTETSAPCELRLDKSCGKCGDGTCVPQCGETSTSCPADCGGAEPSVVASRCGKCGDGKCVPQCGETSTSCPADCGGAEPSAVSSRCGKCGDGKCVPQCGETSTSCPSDCGGGSPSSTSPAA